MCFSCDPEVLVSCMKIAGDRGIVILVESPPETVEIGLQVELLRRELAVLRDQRAGLHPSKRPDYAPEQRLAILQVMRLRGWNAKDTARRFVLHPNTVRSWIKIVDGRPAANSPVSSTNSKPNASSMLTLACPLKRVHVECE